MPPLPLSFALYYEGASDRHFLPGLIQRTVNRLIWGRQRYDIEVQDVLVVNEWNYLLVNEWNYLPPPTGSYRNRVLEAARRAYGYDVLIIHRDADAPDRTPAMRRYIEPACEYISKSFEDVCKICIPIIPVRCIEAWMLADAHAIVAVTDTNVRVDQLNLPATPAQVESISNPKEELRRAVETARGSNRRGRRGMEVEGL